MSRVPAAQQARGPEREPTLAVVVVAIVIPPMPGEEPVEVDPDELDLVEAGFRTTVAAAKAALDEYGYTVEFFADIYASFRDELDARVREAVGDDIAQKSSEPLTDQAIDAAVEAHMAHSRGGPLDDLRAFTAFLRRAIETDLRIEPFLADVKLGQTGQSVSARDYLRFRKGEALERLMAAVCSLSPALQVVARNYSTDDEEIDLVIKNNVSRPFWQGLGSPLIFVECKNWTARVGAPEVRNFEVKLQNHQPVMRVGILVAPNGFTSEATNAVKRSSRDPYTLVLVTGEDLGDLANGAESVLDWLERLICRPV